MIGTANADEKLEAATKWRRSWYQPNVRGITVHDGDTLHYREDGYRLDGIDTPELSGCSRALGVQARERLRSLLASGKVRFKRSVRREKYGRWLLRATVDGQDIAAILVTDGLARWYEGGQRRPWC